MLDDKDKVIDLIQKCLKLSDSPNENEAEAALAKAQELLEKYNLTMEQVKLEEDGSPCPELISQDIQVGSSTWRKYLLFYIAKNNFCDIILGQSGYVHLLGRTPNVAAVIEMTNWIMPQLDRMAMEEVAKIRDTYLDPETQTFRRTFNESRRRFKEDFLWGAVKRINERLRESRLKRVDADPNTKALITNLEVELMAFIANLFPKTSKSHVKTRSWGRGFSTGYEAANGISIVGPSRHIEPGGRYLNSGR